ncbi:DUF6941 family protein [Chloroflexota bacterium]
MTKEKQNTFSRGPYVQIAAFCERLLREGDGVLSLIRIVDRITHTEYGPNAPHDMPEIQYPLTLVLTLKSGTARGRHDITITPEQPSGETLRPFTQSIMMEGENKGANMVMPINMPYKFEGLYWFNIMFDDQIMTRIPLEVRYTRTIAGQSTPEP